MIFKRTRYFLIGFLLSSGRSSTTLRFDNCWILCFVDAKTASNTCFLCFSVRKFFSTFNWLKIDFRFFLRKSSDIEYFEFSLVEILAYLFCNQKGTRIKPKLPSWLLHCYLHRPHRYKSNFASPNKLIVEPSLSSKRHEKGFLACLKLLGRKPVCFSTTEDVVTFIPQQSNKAMDLSQIFSQHPTLKSLTNCPTYCKQCFLRDSIPDSAAEDILTNVLYFSPQHQHNYTSSRISLAGAQKSGSTKSPNIPPISGP